MTKKIQSTDENRGSIGVSQFFSCSFFVKAFNPYPVVGAEHSVLSTFALEMYVTPAVSFNQGNAFASHDAVRSQHWLSYRCFDQALPERFLLRRVERFTSFGPWPANTDPFNGFQSRPEIIRLEEMLYVCVGSIPI